MKRLLPLACLIAMAGCDAQDKLATTEFKPDVSSGTFEFKATADAAYPAGDPAAEARRIGFLEQYLTDNGICPSGYAITNRQEVHVHSGLLGSIVDILYSGRCNP